MTNSLKEGFSYLMLDYLHLLRALTAQMGNFHLNYMFIYTLT